MRNYEILDAVIELIEYGFCSILNIQQHEFEYECARLGIKPIFAQGVLLGNGLRIYETPKLQELFNL